MLISNRKACVKGMMLFKLLAFITIYIPLLSFSVKYSCLSLKFLAACCLIKKYNDFEYIDSLKPGLPPELTTFLRAELIKLRHANGKFPKGYDQSAAVHEAVYFGYTDVVSAFFNEFKFDKVFNSDKLSVAVRMEHLEIARFLLTVRQFDVNTIDVLKHTPLYYAAQTKNKAMVSLLLEYGARVHVTSYNSPIPTPFQAIDQIWPEYRYSNDPDRNEIIKMLKEAELKQDNKAQKLSK